MKPKIISTYQLSAIAFFCLGTGYLLGSCIPKNVTLRNPALENALSLNSPITKKDKDFKEIKEISNRLVFIQIDLPNSENLYCHGYLLTGKKILTAAHCFIDSEQKKFLSIKNNPDYQSGKIFLNNYENMNYSKVDLYNNFTYANPEKNEFDLDRPVLPSSGDFAIVTLPAEILSGLEYQDPLIDISTISDKTAIQRTAFFGRSDVDKKSWLTDYGKFPTLNFTSFTFSNPIDTKKHVIINTQGPSVVEQGDSGSPFFVKINQQWKIAGLLSGYRENSKTKKIEFAWSSEISKLRDWIQSQL